MSEEMMNRLAEAIREEFGTECEVQFQNVRKNNGLMLKAVIIREPGVIVVPTIYIDETLDMLASERINVCEAAQDIVGIYRGCSDKENFEEIISHLSTQSILENVTYQLINAEKNEDRLTNIPHRRFLDLAYVYRVTVNEDEMGTASFLINNGLQEQYGLDKEELDNAARKNTEKQGLGAMTMGSIMAEIMGEAEDEIETGCSMWVLSNGKRVNGAVVMLYPDLFRSLADKSESDLYVLPSSIHEVIAIPDNGEDTKELKLMVSAVNSSEVSEEEYLSGNVYKYIRRENRLIIV